MKYVSLAIILIITFVFIINSQPNLVVVRVIDGDTIVLSNNEVVRLIGIDTPELHNDRTGVQFFGNEAYVYLKRIALNQSVTLRYDNSRRDKYNRLLAYVTLKQSNVCLNEEMVRQGYAFVYIRFPFQQLNKFCKLQNEAVQSGRGIWSECWRDSLVTIKDKQDLIRKAFK